MQQLLEQQAQRAETIAKFGGPETLLHGDLWPINVMVDRDGEALRARLIDWDHAGVGPISYDISNFLAHFPPQDRQWILEAYLEAFERSGWRCLPDTDWNLLFDTAECARLAHEVTWAAIDALEDPADWVFDDLAAAERWFQMLEPILPSESAEKEVRR
jgi:thiamine kinase-like enzyme